MKHKCTGTRNYASCIETQIELPEFSTLLEEECLSVEDLEEEFYTLIGELRDNTNLDELDNDCIVWTTPKTPKSALKQKYEKICELQTTVEEQMVLIEELQTKVTNLEENNCG